MATKTAGAADTDKLFVVEQNGINLIPDSERHGHPRELFWVWAGANINLTFIISGSLIAGLGLTPSQMWMVVLAGNLLFLLVGYGGIPGARVGTATLVISRAAFGRKGNFVPAFLSWLTVVGWEAVNLALGAFALFSLLATIGLPLGAVGKGIALLVLAAVTFGVAILGHSTILALQKVFTWGLGIVMLGVVPQVFMAPVREVATGRVSAGLVAMSIALGLVAALPISFANYPADYTRYLSKTTSGMQVTLWAAFGAALPSVSLTALGYYAAQAADLTDPVAGFAPLLTSWYFNLFVVVVLFGTITNNFLNTYSSGLSLLAMDLRMSRPSAILIDAVLATAAAAYAIFFYDFTTAFIGFLSLMVVWLAPWTAVYVTDIFLRNSKYKGADLLSASGGEYGYRGGYHFAGLVALLLGAAAALLCTSTELVKSPFATTVLAGGDLSIIIGFVVAAIAYFTLAGRTIRSSAKR